MKTILLILALSLTGCLGWGYYQPSVGVTFTPGYYGGYRPYNYQPYYYRPFYRNYYRPYYRGYRQRYYNRWH